MHKLERHLSQPITVKQTWEVNGIYTDFRRVDLKSETSGKKTNAEDENTSEQIKPHAEPSLKGDGHIVGSILKI